MPHVDLFNTELNDYNEYKYTFLGFFSWHSCSPEKYRNKIYRIEKLKIIITKIKLFLSTCYLNHFAINFATLMFFCCPAVNFSSELQF